MNAQFRCRQFLTDRALIVGDPIDSWVLCSDLCSICLVDQIGSCPVALGPITVVFGLLGRSTVVMDSHVDLWRRHVLVFWMTCWSCLGIEGSLESVCWLVLFGGGFALLPFLVGSLLGVCLRLGMEPNPCGSWRSREDAQPLGGVHLSGPGFWDGVREKIRLTEKTNPRLISEHHLGRQPIPRRRVSENESLIFIVRMEMPEGGEWLYHTLKNLRGLANTAGCTDPRL